MEGFEYTDRYGGGKGPDPDTMCKGSCDGMGRYPVSADNPNLTAEERNGIKDVINEAGSGNADGWYFIKCPTCGGTGNRPEPSS
jgi:hypothetical protein